MINEDESSKVINKNNSSEMTNESDNTLQN